MSVVSKRLLFYLLSLLWLIIRVLFIGDHFLSLFIHALLFICAEAFIDCFSNIQDIRYIGNLVNYLFIRYFRFTTVILQEKKIGQIPNI